MEGSKAAHIAIIPSPGMGHLIPFIELAKQLVNHQGFTVTLIVACDGPPSKAQRTVLDSLPSSISSVFLPPVDLTDLPPTASIATRISLTVTRSNPELRRVFNTFSEEDRLPKALVVDLFGTDAFDVAVEFKVSPFIFYSSTANVLSFFLHLPKLDETVSCEYRELTEQVKLPGCTPLSGTDLLDTAQDRKKDGYKWLLHNTKRYKEAEGILVNTFVDLEPNAIKELQKPDLDIPPIYPIGPLVNRNQLEVNNKIEEPECLKWLDKQPSDSVLFVCFGSGGTLTCEQLNELALGLANSNQRFLWVIRSPSKVASSSYFDSHSKTDPLTFLPNLFLEETKEKGFVIPYWAPQAQVLAHPSIGGFLTHCGWNSSLEGIVNGVPLIAWPLYAEQKMNAVLLTEDIRVAFRARAGEDGVVRKEEVEKVVKGLMEGEEGREVREKMKEMKEGACRVLKNDAGFTNALSQLAV